MKEKVTYLDDENKIPMIFTLNVMQEIQEKYGSLEKWKDMVFKNDDGEPEIKPLLFGLTAMANEGIDIVNEDSEAKLEFVSEKQMGREITKIGLLEATKRMGNTVVNGTTTDETPKNE